MLFGPELSFTDLIDEHEGIHGPLWKYTSSIYTDRDTTTGQLLHGTSVGEDGGGIGSERGGERGSEKGVFHRGWDSTTDAERLLYHKITNRIDDALMKLNYTYHVYHAKNR